MQQIIEHGKVTRGWIGVEGAPITARAAMATGDSNIKGALIVGVFIDGPADKAGIRADDIVVAVNGEPIVGVRDLLEKITMHQPGDIIEVSVLRGPQQSSYSVRAIERP